MKSFVKFCCLITCVLSFMCCAVYGHSQHNVGGISALDLGKIIGDKIIIAKTVNLRGNRVVIPEGFTLEFKKGVIKNGILVGNQTKVICQKKAFEHVSIEGSWNVPRISTTMFVDLDYENSLRDVFALTNPKIHNTVYVGRGNYILKARKNCDRCIDIGSNTDVMLEGNLNLMPNNFTNYNILHLSGENIRVNGQGTVVGDKHTHTGTKGEWGMGVDIDNGNSVSVSGITIKDCWGDCIYIGGNSRNIIIDNCTLIHGRRQGISITSANGVTIKNCRITDVGGTRPEYAIDVEPNAGDVVDNVIIDGVVSYDCKGGLCAYGTAPNAKIGSIIIRNCDISSEPRMTIEMDKCESVVIEHNRITRHNNKRVIACDLIDHIVVQNNELIYNDDGTTPKSLGVVSVFHTKTKKIERNRERQK